MQETRVWSLIWEDPTFLRATGPMYNYWACALKPRSLNYGSLSPRVHALQQEKPLQREVHLPQLESIPCLPQLEKSSNNEDPAQPTKKKFKERGGSSIYVFNKLNISFKNLNEPLNIILYKRSSKSPRKPSMYQDHHTDNTKTLLHF